MGLLMWRTGMILILEAPVRETAGLLSYALLVPGETMGMLEAVDMQ
jgi:hypothetical protein